ncbi:hypothetical protein J8273_4551 [Carpediemonas membranifera]|uniref:Uncharacterized protein n=1 Tax=Carpediemonas membranifera TaxID=201153 RepID=A0A8J6BXY7_9EUKA|nr:hypothetical protein J8273_4551 [Carpediemonas membranifera]|eukprot:KAG9393951.1 hypothetical protein J8273_4551 [Carpediemonas membranifera]
MSRTSFLASYYATKTQMPPLKGILKTTDSVASSSSAGPKGMRFKDDAQGEVACDVHMYEMTDEEWTAQFGKPASQRHAKHATKGQLKAADAAGERISRQSAAEQHMNEFLKLAKRLKSARLESVWPTELPTIQGALPMPFNLKPGEASSASKILVPAGNKEVIPGTTATIDLGQQKQAVQAGIDAVKKALQDAASAASQPKPASRFSAVTRGPPIHQYNRPQQPPARTQSHQHRDAPYTSRPQAGYSRQGHQPVGRRGDYRGGSRGGSAYGARDQRYYGGYR